MRPPFLVGVFMLLILLLMASPISIFAARKMFIQASFNSAQTELGVSVNISGRIFDSNNASISNAVVSIQVNNPLNTSIHVALVYTDTKGVFHDQPFLVSTESPAGNYTAYITADKPGYDKAQTTLTFSYSTPDFSIQTSMTALSLMQGQSGNLTVTILSLRGFNDPVNLTAVDPPTGVTIQFAPTSLVPSGTSIARVVVSSSAPAGNHTVTVLAVSGSLTHKASFQLEVKQAPVRDNFMWYAGVAAIVLFLVSAGLLIRSRRKRRRREAALEELIRQAEADTGYVATARVIARLEELRAMNKVDEATYQHLKREYEKRLEKSK